MGKILLFVQEDTPSKLLLDVNIDNAVENSLIWFKKKKFFSGLYKLNVSLFKNHMQGISEGFNQYLSKFDGFISLRDFNAEKSNSHIQHFCAVFNLKTLFEKASCIKNLERPTGIDQILANYTKFL